jgi:rhamnosyltransferase
MDRVMGVIVTYNPDIGILKKNISSIIGQVSKLLVMDNNSDNFFEIAALVEENNWKDIILKHYPINKGIAYAYNQGFQIAKSMGMEAVLTLDQDSICPDSLIGSLGMYLAEDDVAIVCPSVVDRNAPTQITEEEPVKDVSSCINSGALIKVAVWEQIGGYDEQLFIDLVDYDFCKRAINKGYRIKWETKEAISHAIGEKKVYRIFGIKIKIYNHPASRKYYQVRNRFYLAYKYHGRITADPIMRMAILLVKVWIWEKDKRNKTAAVVRGAGDGCKLGRGIIQTADKKVLANREH